MTKDDPPRRLDLALVARGLAASRAQARDLVKRGAVSVRGTTASRPAMAVAAADAIAVAEDAGDFVSRGALKLLAALDHFSFDPVGRTALDVGASTGGFTQVLLQRGAAHVYAVDVGHGQLNARIAGDARVTSLESRDARSLTRADIPEPIGAIVADVSFISVIKALPAALALSVPGCWLVVLVKPQFEAGRKAIGKRGIVRDPDDRQRALATVESWVRAQPNWRIVGSLPSPIAGGSGNVEFLLGAIHGA
jgi:23S rRNA (cytidine1920-2'-O)/16S rRNA (cytidine1409-2'-O)-methyltransferase